jgi:hypothetical protein
MAFSMPFLSMPLKRKANEGLGLSINLRGMALAAGLGAVASFLNMATSPYDNQGQVASAGLNVVH